VLDRPSPQFGKAPRNALLSNIGNDELLFLEGN